MKTDLSMIPCQPAVTIISSEKVRSYLSTKVLKIQDDDLTQTHEFVIDKKNSDPISKISKTNFQGIEISFASLKQIRALAFALRNDFVSVVVLNSPYHYDTHIMNVSGAVLELMSHRVVIITSGDPNIIMGTISCVLNDFKPREYNIIVNKDQYIPAMQHFAKIGCKQDCVMFSVGVIDVFDEKEFQANYQNDFNDAAAIFQCSSKNTALEFRMKF